jgi:hypothetical protein
MSVENFQNKNINMENNIKIKQGRKDVFIQSTHVTNLFTFLHIQPQYSFIADKNVLI